MPSKAKRKIFETAEEIKIIAIKEVKMKIFVT